MSSNALIVTETHPSSMSQYQQFIHMSRYSRFLDIINRREFWTETPRRYIEFFRERLKTKYPSAYEHFEAHGLFDTLYDGIYNLESMPSMRALMTAGPALDRDNMAAFNCSYSSTDAVRALDEIVYILMCGTGNGFTVERQFVAHLPVVGAYVRQTEDGQVADVKARFEEVDHTIVVRDSKTGWADAYRQLLRHLYDGQIPKWDVSKVRPAGARLKTFGGRASGPDPLVKLFKFTISVFKNALGRRLTSIEVHDIVCFIADIVVVGGVRRSALISLSNLSDDRMRNAKNGRWWEDHAHRSLANNSTAYTEKPDFEIFLKEWVTLYESRSGERGVFNRVAAKRKAAKNGRRDPNHEFGTNPCGEIILRPYGLCNLSEVVIRPDDEEESLLRKVTNATILGTLQSTLTDFRYVRDIWRKNAEEERLLGVSLTGIFDNPLMYDISTPEKEQALRDRLDRFREHAIAINAQYADMLGINRSAAITTIKPSGTVSQLVNCSSGIHPGYSEFYIRRVRADMKDPLAQYMINAGVPYEEDKMKPGIGVVFSFPQKAAPNALLRDQIGAMGQIKLYQIYKDHWCEHNPSITVYYKDHEFLEIGNWIYNNFEDVGGISFLPHTDHIYEQAPYEEINEEQYNALVAAMPELNWTRLQDFEKEDSTTGQQTFACTGNVCEIVDLNA